jgi:uncharacterized protein (DUF58 family)
VTGNKLELLWDPEVLEKIESLRIESARVVDGIVAGGHLSRNLGVDVEFSDYKEYTPGDSLRHLDWRVYGRTDRYVVRRYQLESELPVMLVLDASGDMATADKFAHTVKLVACLAMYLHRQNEPVGLVVVGGETLGERNIPPRTGRAHLAQIFAAIASIKPSGVADLSAGICAVADSVRVRSVVVFASDFMEPVDRWSGDLTALQALKHHVVALHIMDRAELDLDLDTPARFFSPENGELVTVDPVSAREAFSAEVQSWRSAVEDAFLDRGSAYEPAWTTTDLTTILVHLIEGVK